MKLKSVCINASDLATIIGINRHQNLSDLVVKIWQRNWDTDYQRSVNQIREKYGVDVRPAETDRNYIKSMENKEEFRDLQLKEKMDKCMASTDTTSLLMARSEIMFDINKSTTLSAEVKDTMKQNIMSATNKHFGTKNETNVAELYSKSEKKKIITIGKYLKRKFYECEMEYSGGGGNGGGDGDKPGEKVEWFLGGKIDGLTDDDIIIEIKNRIYRLFGSMRDYERPQLQCYMFILGLSEGHLIECLQRKSDVSMNIIRDKFDQEYWNNCIIVRLINFIKLIQLLMRDESMKIYTLLGNGEERDTMFIRFIEGQKIGE